MKNRNKLISLMIYILFIMNGLQLILLSQNVSGFAEAWGTDAAGVFGVISATGIGKFVVMLFAGNLTDRIGRKPVLALGMLGYLIYFVGLLFCDNIYLAYFLSFAGGAGGSFMDAAGYPALYELNPDHSDSTAVIGKGFLSIGGLYPFVISLLDRKGIPFKTAILIPLVLLAINLVLFLLTPYPESTAKDSAKEDEDVIDENEDHPLKTIDGWSLILMSFFSFATFYMWQQTTVMYAENARAMNSTITSLLIPVYNVGTMASVIISTIQRARGTSNLQIIKTYSVMSLVALLIASFFKSNAMYLLASFLIGYFGAGGIWQTGNTILMDRFPSNRGRNTAYYSIAMAVCTYIIPVIVQNIININLNLIPVTNIIVAVVNVVLCFFINKRLSK